MEAEQQDERAFFNLLLSAVSEGRSAAQVAEQMGLYCQRILPEWSVQLHLKGEGEELAVPGEPDLHPVGRGTYGLRLGPAGLIILQAGRPLSESRKRFLGRMARQASGVLAQLEEMSLVRAEVNDLRQQRQRLQTESDWLFHTLELLQSAGHSLDSQSLWESFRPLMADLVPGCRAFLAQCDPTTQEWTLRAFEGDAHPAPSSALIELLEVTSRYQRGLDYGDLATTRFAQAMPPMAALATAPLSFLPGCLALAHPQALEFAPEALRNLSIAAALYGCLERMVALHQQTVQAMAALKESQMQLVETGRSAAIGQVAGGVAHEMNNPLAAVRLALEAANRQQDLSKSLKLCLQPALDAIGRCQQLTQDLLRFSRESQHQQQTRPVEVDEIVGATLALLTEQARAHQVELTCIAAPGLWLEVNAGEIQQALVQLLDNALQASRARVEVSCSEDLGKARIAVADDGTGVAVALHEKIFEPFFTTRPMAEGTGLGLAIARRIARKYGGDVRLESSQAGALFVLELPTTRRMSS